MTFQRRRPGRMMPPAGGGGDASITPGDPTILVDPRRVPWNASGAPVEPSSNHELLEHYWGEGRANYGPPPPETLPGGGPIGAVPSVQIHPVWEFNPTNAYQFYLNQTSSQQTVVAAKLPAVKGASLLLPGLVYKPPDFMSSVLRLVSIFVDAPDATLNVSWVVRLNQAPYPGFTFTTFPRLAANLSIDFDVLLRDIPQNTTIDMIIMNNANTGPWTVGGALSGWSYTKQDEIRLYGAMAV